jgi:hypothetical protein
VTPPESSSRRGVGVQFVDPPAHFRERLDRYIEKLAVEPAVISV